MIAPFPVRYTFHVHIAYFIMMANKLSFFLTSSWNCIRDSFQSFVVKD